MRTYYQQANYQGDWGQGMITITCRRPECIAHGCFEYCLKPRSAVPQAIPQIPQENSSNEYAYQRGYLDGTAKRPRPLTDDQIKVIEQGIWKPEFFDDTERQANREFARAIEAAHGIAEK